MPFSGTIATPLPMVSEAKTSSAKPVNGTSTPLTGAANASPGSLLAEGAVLAFAPALIPPKK